MASRITGRIEVLVNGVKLLNKEGAVASGIGISGEPNFEREPVLGDSGFHGIKETPVVAMVEVTITDREDIPLSDLAKIQGDGTVIFRSASGGKVYTMEQAYCSGNMDITGGEGETKIKFFGPYWTESVAT